ncbi:MAG: hypothetical protein K2F66_04120, partial [Duncaniella sp.]|nr:hypothetical protein [Duncaniella sp.]
MNRMLLPIIMCVVAIASYAQTATEKGTLRTTKDKVVVAIDGKKMKGGWDVLYGNEIDSLVIKGKEIIFTSDIDTL